MIRYPEHYLSNALLWHVVKFGHHLRPRLMTNSHHIKLSVSTKCRTVAHSFHYSEELRCLFFCSYLRYTYVLCDARDACDGAVVVPPERARAERPAPAGAPLRLARAAQRRRQRAQRLRVVLRRRHCNATQTYFTQAITSAVVNI